MAFTGTDIQAALGAGWPNMVESPNAALSIEDAAIIYGVGASMAEGEPDTDRAHLRKRRRVAVLYATGRI